MRRTVISFISIIVISVFFIYTVRQNVSADDIMPGSIFSRITVSAAGDCTLGTDANFSWNSSLPAKYNEVGDPSYFLGGVKSVFEGDDLTIVNMEGTLTDRGSRADKTYAFRGDPSYTSILTSGSVEATNLSNNHSRDYGEISYNDTVMYLDEAGIITFGEGLVKVVSINGINVGLVGVYELPYGINCKSSLLERIQIAKDMGASLIIANFHWGTEREYYPDSIQKDLAHTAIDNGADLVIGHHPHVLQGIEKYKNRYIAYSLGNFCFGGNKNPSDKDTMIFQQTFTFMNGSLVTDVYPQGVFRDRINNSFSEYGSVIDCAYQDSVNIIPCSLSSNVGYNDYRPRVLEREDADRVISRLREYSIPFYR